MRAHLSGLLSWLICVGGLTAMGSLGCSGGSPPDDDDTSPPVGGESPTTAPTETPSPTPVEGTPTPTLAPTPSTTPPPPSPTPAGVPDVAPAATTVAFGTQVLGGSASQVMRIDNVGTGVLHLSLNLVPVDGGLFVISNASSLPTSLEAAAGMDVELSFSPQAEGASVAVVVVASDDPDEPVLQVTLTGSGVAVEDPDLDGDGSPASEDCDDADSHNAPGGLEICDGQDNNCDGRSDEDLPQLTLYEDVDQDGHGDPEKAVQDCGPSEGIVSDGDDCDDGDPAAYPGASELCDGKDNDCDGQMDEDGATPYYPDGDGDGYGTGNTPLVTCAPPEGYSSQAGDCNDGDISVKPGATESCNGVDDNCDGRIDEGLLTTFYADTDGDTYGTESDTLTACSAPSGYVSLAQDCNDADSSIHPGAAEICDGTDNNCSGQIDEDVTSTFYLDADGDGHGNPAAPAQACVAGGELVSSDDDCDDSSSEIHPSAPEVCDGLDNDCDDAVDEGVTLLFYQDADQDGYGTPTKSVEACVAPSGYVADNTDCKDTNDTIHPGASERCNQVDDDCDGQVDEEVASTYYQDADGDGYGDATRSISNCNPPAGYVSNSSDCNDADPLVNPGETELCDGIDNNCNGQRDEGVKQPYYKDLDGDGYGNPSSVVQACTAPEGYVSDNTDCADNNVTIHPGAIEYCNTLDDDCDGVADEGAGVTYYRDQDLDTFGDPSSPKVACSQPSGYVTNQLDCDDNSSSRHPNASELCNGADDDCDGQIDEGVLTTWYRDSDSDSFGDPTVFVQACSRPAGYVSNSGDCKDTNDAIHPGAQELPNGIDEDCDGVVDNGVYHPTCAKVLFYIPGSTSGMYTIDPDGTLGPIQPFKTWCDMSTDGGGWTLVAYAGDYSAGFPRMDIDVGNFVPDSRQGKASRGAVGVVRLSSEMALAYHPTVNFSGNLGDTTDTIAMTIPDPSIVDFKTISNNGTCVAVAARRMRPVASNYPCIGSTSSSKVAVSSSNCNPTSGEATAGVWSKSLGGTYSTFAYGIFGTQWTCNSWPNISHHWWVDAQYYNWEPSQTQAWSGTVNGATSIWLR